MLSQCFGSNQSRNHNELDHVKKRTFSEPPVTTVAPGGKSYRDVASNGPPSLASVAAAKPIPLRSVIIPSSAQFQQTVIVPSSMHSQQNKKSAVAATKSTPPLMPPKPALSSPSLVGQVQKVAKKEKQKESNSENTTPVRKQQDVVLTPIEPMPVAKRSPKKPTSAGK